MPQLVAVQPVAEPVVAPAAQVEVLVVGAQVLAEGVEVSGVAAPAQLEAEEAALPFLQVAILVQLGRVARIVVDVLDADRRRAARSAFFPARERSPSESVGNKDGKESSVHVGFLSQEETLPRIAGALLPWTREWQFTQPRRDEPACLGVAAAPSQPLPS